MSLTIVISSGNWHSGFVAIIYDHSACVNCDMCWTWFLISSNRRGVKPLNRGDRDPSREPSFVVDPFMCTRGSRMAVKGTEAGKSWRGIQEMWRMFMAIWRGWEGSVYNSGECGVAKYDWMISDGPIFQDVLLEVLETLKCEIGDDTRDIRNDNLSVSRYYCENPWRGSRGWRVGELRSILRMENERCGRSMTMPLGERLINAGDTRCMPRIIWISRLIYGCISGLLTIDLSKQKRSSISTCL